MKEMKRAFGEIALWCSFTTIAMVFFSTLVGFLPFLSITEDCFCVPLLTEEFVKDIEKTLGNSLRGQILRCIL